MTPQEQRLSTLLSDDVDDGNGFDLDAWDELDGEEQEELEVEVVDAATAAATVAELEFEIRTLEQLEELARRLRGQGVDAKWVAALRTSLDRSGDVRARRLATQAAHLHRAPRHDELPRRSPPDVPR